MNRVGLCLLLGCTTLAVACNGGDGGGAGDDIDAGSVVADGGGGQPDAFEPPQGWKTLALGDWTIPGGSGDVYKCIVATIPETMYVKTFRPLIPSGTHHTVVTIYTGDLPDGIHDCGVGTNGMRMIYGSGVGSPDFTFPTGVAIKLNQGDRILVNLHLYNLKDNPISGTSGTLAQTIPASEVQNEAELVLMGPTSTLMVPPGISTQSGSCTIKGDTHVFAAAPHMHMTATHWKSVATKGGQEIVLADQSYTFDDQVFYNVSPFVELKAGDKITTYCTYNFEAPPGTPPKTFGESSNDEMCFSSVYYYPKRNSFFICSF